MIIILGGIGSLRGVVIGAFAVASTSTRRCCRSSATTSSTPRSSRSASSTGIELLRDFKPVTYNYLIFGIVLAVMMVRRPEGLFPVEAAKAEMHGIGVAAEVDGRRRRTSWPRSRRPRSVIELEEAPLPDPNAATAERPAGSRPGADARSRGVTRRCRAAQPEVGGDLLVANGLHEAVRRPGRRQQHRLHDPARRRS